MKLTYVDALPWRRCPSHSTTLLQKGQQTKGREKEELLSAKASHTLWARGPRWPSAVVSRVKRAFPCSLDGSGVCGRTHTCVCGSESLVHLRLWQHCLLTGYEWMKESHSVVSNSLQHHGRYSPWNSPGQNTGVGSLSLLQGIFPTQGSNPGLPHCRQILYPNTKVFF